MSYYATSRFKGYHSGFPTRTDHETGNAPGEDVLDEDDSWSLPAIGGSANGWNNGGWTLEGAPGSGAETFPDQLF
jgi:hypothetical protein